MNIYCFSTLSFAKLQFKSVINKAFHKHGVASFTDAWIETKDGKSKPVIVFESHLLQMRGLKPINITTKALKVGVASFTDAWIETKGDTALCTLLFVASFTDAWIETAKKTDMMKKKEVASFTDAWIETLSFTMTVIVHTVASFTDAWIETMLAAGYDGAAESHLLQMRGLKPMDNYCKLSYRLSHLLQMRGLKPSMNTEKLKPWVASFTDAWIETHKEPCQPEYPNVASFTDAWIETRIVKGERNFI